MFIAQRMVGMLSAPRWAFVYLHYAYIPFVAFACASSALAMAQALGWHPVPEWNPANPAGFLFNSIAQGEFLALCVVVLVAFRYYWPILALAPGLYLAGSRGAWAALALGILATYFRKPLWLLILTLSFALYWSTNPGSSDLQRLIIWRAAWTHFTFWGNGFGSFWYLWIGNPAWWPQYAHNDYLQTVFELGVWAVIPFSILTWACSRTTAPQWPILITFLFMATFSMPLHIPVALALGAVALASTLESTNA